MKSILKILLVSLLFIAFSCNENSLSTGNSDSVGDVFELVESKDHTSNEVRGAIKERQIIKEGEITFETENAAKTKELIGKSVIDFGGYLSKDEVNDYGDKLQYEVTVRVPSKKFDELLTHISESAGELESKNIRALDITEEYIDVEARIKTKKELENCYNELLIKATTVDDILSIQREMGALRAEIESLEGRLRYLKDRVSLSTLTVVFYEKTNRGLEFVSRFGQALKNGWSFFVGFLIVLANLWVFLVIATIAIVMFKAVRKKRSK